MPPIQTHGVDFLNLITGLTVFPIKLHLTISVYNSWKPNILYPYFFWLGKELYLQEKWPNFEIFSKCIGSYLGLQNSVHDFKVAKVNVCFGKDL